MTSSASLLLLAALAPVDTTVPAALAARVEATIAARWGVAADALELSWGAHAAWPPGVADAPLRVIGGGEDGWFVATLDPPAGRPLAVRVRAGVRGPALVAARDLAPGHPLADGDAHLEDRVAWGPPAIGGVVVGEGWEVRRAIAAGTVLAPPLVQPARLVAPGDAVTFVWQRGALVLERVGIARAGARLGEPIQAVAGETRLHGTVIAPRRARLEEAP